MEVSLSTLIGSAAGCTGHYSFVPQVVKCCRSGDVAAISVRTFAVRTFGLLLWTVYGFALGSMPVLVFSALGLTLSSVILGDEGSRLPNATHGRKLPSGGAGSGGHKRG
jgi:MtN3 and saliva related transmembrane protein